VGRRRSAPHRSLKTTISSQDVAGAALTSQLVDAVYLELRDPAPEKQMLKRYQANELSWDNYPAEYSELLAKRRVERNLDIALFDRACLLCSEDRAEHCHRTIAVEYLNLSWDDDLKVTHLF
jgi:uncharacterized protein YeaO (DUF488 family)